MGTLGVSLLFVGIVLVMNGVARFQKWDAKSIAFFNAVTGSIIVILNIIGMTKTQDTFEIFSYQNIASGLLFGVTYLFLAANHLFKLDWRPFGWFSLFVTIYAVIMAINGFDASDPRMTLLWIAWAILWFEGFVEICCSTKKMSQQLYKLFPYLTIAEGIFAAFVPAIFMLIDKW